jgi:hypothetical protein
MHLQLLSWLPLAVSVRQAGPSRNSPKVETPICDNIYKGIGNLGVQRVWREIMNVLANPKGSVGRWNLNFGVLSNFTQIFEARVL